MTESFALAVHGTRATQLIAPRASWGPERMVAAMIVNRPSARR